MIRGALEVANSVEVAGWMYSDVIELHGVTVLAFSAGRCVGSGKIDLPRKDLRAAGLGHGKYGFRFEIDLQDLEPGSLVVKLEGSDLCLLHDKSVVSAKPGTKLAFL